MKIDNRHGLSGKRFAGGWVVVVFQLCPCVGVGQLPECVKVEMFVVKVDRMGSKGV
jgi:hypothetical protein